MAADANDQRAQAFKAAVAALSAAIDSDILLFNSQFHVDTDHKLLKLVKGRERRSNVLVILVSEGGSADAAYKVARCLQNNYTSFTIYVHGYCKSAGTLCVLGAHAVIMSDSAELGPLDVQVAKRDELGERSSGLVAGQALASLQTRAYEMYEEYFLQILQGSGGLVTFRTASDIALRMTVGLFEPLYAQINPVEVGEMARSMRIARDYGERLGGHSGNMKSDALEYLCETYPSHGFVIDCDEAKSLFKNIREPTDSEHALAESLGPLALRPLQSSQIRFLNDPPTAERTDDEQEPVNDSPDANNADAAETTGEGASGSIPAADSEGSTAT
jgi:hypothetical protein